MASPGPGTAIELGVAYLSIVGETDRLARSVREGMREAQRYADAHPLKLRADVDVSHIRRLTIPVDADMAGFATQVSRTLRTMERSGLFRLNIPVDLNSAAAIAQMEALRRQLEARATPITQTIDIDVDRSALNKIKSVGSLGGLSVAAGGLSAAAAGIAAIGGAAGAALGGVAALGVGLAALGPAAAAAGATAAVGLAGIGDAFKAISAASDSAASDGQAQAKAVAAAQEQVATALENVESAQSNLADAQKDAESAQTDLAQAYKDAADELEDYNLQLRDAALSEKEAALAVKEAQEDLAKASPAEREKAVLRLERAQLRLAEAQERNRDTQEAAADAEAKGIENSDRVVEAKDRAAEADQRVADAEQALSKAHAQVSKAQQAVTDAMNQSSSAQDKAAQALAKLSPNAQAFVLAMRELGPAWTDVRKSVQDNLFEGLDQSITQLATAALPTLQAGMGEVATSMNGLTRTFADFWRAPANLAAIESIFAGTARFIDGMGPGLQQATQGFLSLGQAFEPVAQQIGNQLGGLLGQIGQSFTDAFQSGALTELIGNFGDILQGLGEGLNPLLDGLIQIGNIVGPTLGPLFAQLGESLGSLAPSLGALGATFAETLTALLPDLAKFIDALATGLEPVLPVIGDLLQSLGTALTPLIGPMSEIAQIVGIALSQAITALAPAVGPLGQAFASLVAAVAPLLPVLAEVVSGLVQALAPALTEVFDALGPVIKQTADALMPVFRELQPILADVASQIGHALADALTQIAPVLPSLAQSFGEVVLAIAPLLPQLIEMAAELLPPLIDLFVQFAPVVTALHEALAWLITNVINPLVIPGLRTFSDSFRDSFEAAGTAVSTAKDLINGAVEGIGTVIGGLSTLWTTVWDGMVTRLAKSVKSIGEMLQKVKVPDWVPGIGGKGTSDLGDSLVAWGNAHGAATGGLMRGPGSGTSDSIPVWLSDGEYVVNAKSTSASLPLLEALNQGWVPSPDFLRMLLSANAPGFAQGGLVTENEIARMGGGSVNLSIWQAIKSKFPNAVLTSAKTDHDVDGGFHPKGKAIDVSPDRQVLDYLWQNRNQLAQIIFDDPDKVWYNVNGERAEGAKARAIYTEATMKQHRDHIHVAALNEFKDSGVTAQTPAETDNRTAKEKVVDEIVRVGKEMGASDEAIIAALSTGLVESNLENVETGPDGSVGVFQQRNFDEWTQGGTRDRMNVSDSARSFFEHYNQTDPSLSPAERAQAVQRSAYPEKYEQRMGEAAQLYQESQSRSSSGGGGGGGGGGGAGTSDATPVYVTNWPSTGLSPTSTTSVGTTPSTTTTTTPTTTSTYNPTTTTDPTTTDTTTSTPATTTTEDSSQHPLSGIEVPDIINDIVPVNELFDGPSPWYLADSPEKAFSNLQTQAGNLWESTVSDVQGFFNEDNIKEMFETGLGFLGMGAMGGGGDTINVTNNGMDPLSAASAVERVWRRRSLANQRSGGFGR